MTARRLGVGLLSVLVALLVATAPAGAQTVTSAGSGNPSNDAVAVNTKDGSSLFKLAFSVKKVSGDVNASNTAVAYASCSECRTVAAAIQVVLVDGSPDVSTPTNVALAINYQCSECETLAAAYQFVFGDGTDVKLTPTGKQELHDVKKQLQDLQKNSDTLTLQQIADQVGALAAKVGDIVANNLVPTGQSAAPGQQSTTTSSTAGTTTSAPTTSSERSTSTTTAPTSTSTTAP
jgi:putative peptide zinc metalloprotease protein